MTRLEALNAAVDFIDEKVEKAPLKPNGYPQDGFRAMTAPQRLVAIGKLAEFLLGERGGDSLEVL